MWKTVNKKEGSILVDTSSFSEMEFSVIRKLFGVPSDSSIIRINSYDVEYFEKNDSIKNLCEH